MLRTTSLLLGATAAHCAPAAGLYGWGPQQGVMRQFMNGSIANVGASNPSMAVGEQLASLDATRGILYSISYNFKTNKVELFGLNIADGSVSTQVNVEFAESEFVGVGQGIAVEPVNGSVIAMGQLQIEKTPYIIGFVEPSTGTFTQAAQLDAALVPILGGVSAYDPLTNTFLTNLANASDNNVHFYAVDMGSGAVTQWIDGAAPGKEIFTLDFDEASGSFIGLGSSGSPFLVNLERLDARTFTYSTIGTLPKGYDGGLGGITAIVPGAGSGPSTLQYYAMKPGANATDPNTPFYLTGISTADASVVSTGPVPVCTLATYCPWSLEFYPGQ